MQKESIILIANYATDSVPTEFAYSDKQKGAGYQYNNDGSHLVVYQFDEFKGTVKIQATLELHPGMSDWFDVPETIVGGDSTLITSAKTAHSFWGKFMWIRAAYQLEQGTIVQIRYQI
jgi:ATP sulfurylase